MNFPPRISLFGRWGLSEGTLFEVGSEERQKEHHYFEGPPILTQTQRLHHRTQRIPFDLDITGEQEGYKGCIIGTQEKMRVVNEGSQ